MGLVNGLPTIGSSWFLRKNLRIEGVVISIEQPMLNGQHHQVVLHCPSDRPDGVTISLDLEAFLRDWKPPNEPEVESPSKWDVLMSDDDL